MMILKTLTSKHSGYNYNAAMKRYLILLIGLVLGIGAFGQDQEIQPADPKVAEKIQAARIAYITDQLKLTPEEAAAFWPIYREFAEKRDGVKRQIKEGRKNPDPSKSQEENDKELYDLQLKVKQEELNLEKEYSGRMLKVISLQKLRELPDAEKRFRQMVLMQIQRRQQLQDRKRILRDQNQQRLQNRNN